MNATRIEQIRREIAAGTCDLLPETCPPGCVAFTVERLAQEIEMMTDTTNQKFRDWNVMIYLGTYDAIPTNKQGYHLKTVRARTQSEAERKATRLAARGGLSGLIEVSESQ